MEYSRPMVSTFFTTQLRRFARFAPGVAIGVALAFGVAVQNDAAANETFTPKVLSAADADLYRDIFDLQVDGDWRAADAKIKALTDRVLMGYVLEQRYMHPTAYRSTYDELRAWLSSYADHPQADGIYRLALKRRPRGANAPVRPIARSWRAAPDWELPPSLVEDYAKVGEPQAKRIEGRVRYLCKREEALTALDEIDGHLRARRITVRQYDRMRSWIAASLYFQGYLAKAREIAIEAAAQNGEVAVLAHWIEGLIAYREGDVRGALSAFDAMAAIEHQEDSLRAAAGFWAARAALAAGALDRVAPNLEIAAARPLTFYGQLALSQLGRDHVFDWTPPSMTESQFTVFAADFPETRRIVALKDAGRDADADLELRRLHGRAKDASNATLLALAAALDLPAAQIDIALAENDATYAAGLFPVPSFQPSDGFKTDRAVLYALIRQESKFKPEAKSRVGARGLMQVMPRTASYVAKDRRLATSAGRDLLFDPGLNLKIGQMYVNYLLEAIDDGDLFEVATAYNGGPGNLRRWKAQLGIDDPLLFIESIPNSESRDYVEKVLTNIWIYRQRLGQPTPSRDRVAAGEAPVYEALDKLIEDAR
ncbi:MAG: transglycosylase SLT domain-containing protein [Alphaproteobacteria bacterium]|nr:transglycosylase SLT domain-containing protein [Alphaproteobacteria bacterium]